MDLFILVDSVYPHTSRVFNSNIGGPHGKDVTRHWEMYRPKWEPQSNHIHIYQKPLCDDI